MHSKSVYLFFAISLLVGCANERRKDPPVEGLTCVAPPAEFATTENDAGIDASNTIIGDILKAKISTRQKIEKIRETLPGVQTFEVLEYRLCRMYGNKLIDLETYNEFVKQAFPILKPQELQQKKSLIYKGKNEDLASFQAWRGEGSFVYVGGSCKGCENLEKFSGTGIFQPEILIGNPNFISRVDFIRNETTIETVAGKALSPGSNIPFKGISHTIVKVDGRGSNYYGGMTSYCWSGRTQECSIKASETKEMLKFVSYRINLDSYRIRVTKSDDGAFTINLPPAPY